jgi:hypothetical protein
MLNYSKKRLIILKKSGACFEISAFCVFCNQTAGGGTYMKD